MANAEKSITLNALVLSMSGYDDDLSAFLKGFGFSEEELSTVIDELNAYRSIPGTHHRAVHESRDRRSRGR